MLNLKNPDYFKSSGWIINSSAPYGASVNPVGADVHDARALDKNIGIIVLVFSFLLIDYIGDALIVILFIFYTPI